MDVQKRTQLERRLARRISVTLVAAACGLWTLAPSAFAAAPAADALPQNGKVVSVSSGTTDDVKISSANGVMNINQPVDRAIINWDSFNVGESATVNFNHSKDGVQNTAGITLNRVTGSEAGMSQIYGKINAVGSVVLVNQNGILFANGSSVNAAGIVASTADIDTDKFIASGELAFTQKNKTNNNITVNGSLNAAINGDYLTTGDYATTLSNSTLNLGERQVVTEVSTVGNKIMLVADGNVIVDADASGKAALTATTVTNVEATTSTEQKGSYTITKNVAAQSVEGTIVMRADQNADDVDSSGQAATVKLSNTADSQIQALNVNIYYNDEISSASAADIGISGADGTTFNKKAYDSAYSDGLKSKIATSVTKTENTAGSLETTTTADTETNVATYSLVNDIYQLQQIDDNNADTYLSGSYALGRDIDASATASWNSDAGFDPIGDGDGNSDGKAFTGTFTGNGGTGTYDIYDMTINRSDTDYVGLFASANAATITDVGIIGSTIVGKDHVGSIAGRLLGAVTITNCINGSHVKGANYVGGLVGGYEERIGHGITIDNSANKGYYGEGKTVKEGYGVVEASGDYVGGLVGHTTGVTITNSYSNGQVSGANYVGGIVGFSDWATNITNVYNTNEAATLVTVTGDQSPYGQVTGSGSYVGGITGGYRSADGIKNSYNAGNISGNDYVGGIVGKAVGLYRFNNLYNADNNTVIDGKIVYRDAQVKSNGYAGGIIGVIDGDQGIGTHVVEANFYSAGKVTGTTAGGLIGRFISVNPVTTSHALTINNAYFVPELNGVNNAVGLTDVKYSQQLKGTFTSKTAAEMKNFSDLGDAWYVNGTTLPLLKDFLSGEVSVSASGVYQYVYDGTSHGLGEVDGIYGGTFTDGKGQNVYTEGVDKVTAEQLKNVTYATNADGVEAKSTDDTSSSSYYSYDGISIFSPQHGYSIGNANVSGGVIITPKALSYTVNAENTKVYGNTLETSDVLSFTGLAGADSVDLGESVFSVTPTDKSAAAATLTDTTNVGTYDLTVDASAVNTYLTENYSGNYKLGDVGSTAAKLTITQRPVSYTVSGATKIYGDTTLSALDGTWTGYIAADAADFAALDSTGAAKATTAISSAGLDAKAQVADGPFADMALTDSATKTISALITNGNYKLADTDGITVDADAQLTITARGINFDITKATKIYGDDYITGGFSTLVNDDDFGKLALTGNVTGVAATTNAGKQSVTVDNAKLTAFVTEKGKGNYTLAGDGNTLTGDLNITARAIGYKVGDQTKTYGDNATISGTGEFTNLFTGSDLTGKSLTVDDLESDGLDSADLTHKGQVNGGKSYTLTVKDNAVADYIAAINKANGNNNYVLSSAEGAVEDGTLKVNARSVTFDLGKQAITYGDTTIAGNFTTVVEGDDLGAITADALSSGSDVLSGTTGVKGEHAITIDATKLADQVTKNGNGNYALDAGNSTLTGNLTINAKELTYTLADQNLQYGDKASTGEFTGFVNGDNIATDGLKVTEGGAGSLTDAGKTYGISVSEGDVSSLVNTAGSGNYTIATDGNKYTGTVTVTQRQVGYTVGDQTKTYGDGADGISGTGSFTNLFTGSELAGATLAASDLSSDGLGEQADVKTDGTTYTLKVTDKASLEKLIAAKGGSNYVLSDDVTSGTLTVKAKDINYSVGSLEREYLTEGSYTGADATASGVMSWDKDKLANINYTTNAVLDSDAQGGYNISTTVKDVQDALGTNYNVTGVTDGTLKINPTTVYYKADSLSYSKRDGELALTGSIVKADGTTVLGATSENKYLTAADYAALKFVVVDADGNTVDTTGNIEKGEYSIIGTGITGGQNYVLGNPSDWYTNNGAKAAMLTVLSSATSDIVPDLGQYEGAKDDLGASNSTDNGSGLGRNELTLRRGGIIGGAIPSMDRVQYSFKSVESTGINVGDAPSAIYHISIAPSSYVENILREDAGKIEANLSSTDEDEQKKA